MAKFDLVATDFLIKEDILQIKALNPNSRVLGYKDVMYENNQMDDWTVANANEAWFIHDKSGNRVVDSNGGYAMNISNAGWKAHILSYINSFSSYGFDGVWLDDTWTYFWTDCWTVSSSMLYPFPTWHTDMTDLIAYIKAGVGAKIVIENGPNNDDYVAAGDGKVGENFLKMFGAWNDIDSLSSISGQGKYYLAWAKSTDSTTDMMYFLSGYLIGVNGPNTYFGYNNIWSTSEGYYPEFSSIRLLGEPTNNYYSYQSVYARDFVNGKVLFNPDGNAYTINLQGTYVTLDGSTVTTVAMNGNSGQILLQY
jgi:hypothetical protein